MLRLREKYVTPTGELTDAGWQALQGAFDEQEARIAALEVKVAAAAAVANAAGGGTVDTQARTQLAGIKAALT
jgi:hypothetical protein